MVAMVTLVVLALVAGGCGRKPSVPPSHRLEGVYIVHGFFSHRSYGAPCRPVEAGYPDIRKGTEVFSLAVAERDAYLVEVGRRGDVKFSKADLERANWKADLTIGAYTMFGGI